MKEFTPEQVKAILDQAREVDQASIYEGSTDKPNDVQEIVLDLSTARTKEDPYVISSPFKNIFVESSANLSDILYLKPNAAETFQAAFKLDLNSSIEFERPISKAYLYWPQQAGGKVTLKVSLYSKFRTGKVLSLNAGGVSINDGSSISGNTISLVDTSTVQILPADPFRKKATISLGTGPAVHFGAADITPYNGKGLRLNPNDRLVYRNTAALYAAAEMASNELQIMVEK